jgi:hypothetical protein
MKSKWEKMGRKVNGGNNDAPVHTAHEPVFLLKRSSIEKERERERERGHHRREWVAIRRATQNAGQIWQTSELINMTDGPSALFFFLQ